jgi:hypothetical protein
MKTRNTNIEILNKSQARNTTLETPAKQMFGISNLEFRICFEFSTSNFGFTLEGGAR